MKSTFLAILVLISSFPTTFALADTTERVVSIETDANEGMSFIEVTRDDEGSLKLMNYRNHEGKVITYNLDQLRQGPQVVKQSSGHDVVFLSVESDFTAEKGGHANIRFLQNGITGSYKNFRVLVDVQSEIVLRSDPNPRDRESDRNTYTSVFNYVFMAKNTFFGKVIGVDSVTPSMR